MKTTVRLTVIACCFFIAVPIFDMSIDTGMFVSDAEAVIGRPMTPISVAGSARRTTRRTMRRTAVYVASLPKGCASVVVQGVGLYQCGGTYYQPQGSQYVVVHVD
jgi:hypothetical protein